MDDMTAFESQLAVELGQMAGPGRRIDAMAMVRTASTPSPKWRFQSMFSATKFVVAGVIVALFGGFLLLSLPMEQEAELVPAAATTSPSALTTDELLSGLVTEEVEPGVSRVLRDGAGHDLEGASLVDVSLGPDGTPWLLRAEPPVAQLVDGALELVEVLELGREGSHRFENGYGLNADMAVAADGKVWALNLDSAGSLHSFDGTAWSTHELPVDPSGSRSFRTVEVTRDGSVWVTREVLDPIPNRSFARLTDGQWTFLPQVDDPAWLESTGSAYWTDTAVAPNGNAAVVAAGGLLHFDGEAWEYMEPVADREALIGLTAIGPDGTLWFYISERRSEERHLARRDEAGWTVYSAEGRPAGFSPEDGVPLLLANQVFVGGLAVDGDGTLWAFNLEYFPDEGGGECGGVLSFDGATWRQYLRGSCVNGVAIAPDGSVWAASDPGGGDTLNPDLAGLYVIDPNGDK